MQGGIFGANKDLAGTKLYGKGRFACPAHFDLELKMLGVKESQDPKKQKGGSGSGGKHVLLIGEFSVVVFDPTSFVSFLDGSTKSTAGKFAVGDTLSESIDTDESMYGLQDSKELLVAVKHAYERQIKGRGDYTLEQATIDMTNEEANSFVSDPAINRQLVGLAFKLEAWNVRRTNSQTGKPDDFTAKKYSGA